MANDVWWQKEGFVGLYEKSEDTQNKNKSLLVITEDGKVHLEDYGIIYQGDMPDKAPDEEYVVINLKSESGWRNFNVYVRERTVNNAPSKIELFSKGLPATNAPSTQPPLLIHLTKISTEIPKEYVFSDEEKITDFGDEVICSVCRNRVKKTRFCKECGAPLFKQK